MNNLHTNINYFNYTCDVSLYNILFSKLLNYKKQDLATTLTIDKFKYEEHWSSTFLRWLSQPEKKILNNVMDIIYVSEIKGELVEKGYFYKTDPEDEEINICIG